MKNKAFHPFAALAVLAATTAAATAATGSLHSAFGAAGKATANYGGTDSANAVAIMSNGKIVVAGTTTALGTSDFAVLRYNANGTLDTSFDSDGGVITDISGGSVDVASGVAVQSDGKILVVGTNGLDTVLVRYHANGALDTFFGAGGRVITNVSGTDRGTCLAIQNDGKILVGGTNDIGASPDFTILRFNKDGSPDTTFSGDGLIDFTFGGNDLCTSIALQPNGSIILAGFSDDVGTNDFAVGRVTSAGVLDGTFGGGDGQVLTPVSGDDQATSVKVQPDGKILVGGSVIDGSEDFAIARYNTAGTLDTSFSGDGLFVHTFGSLDVARGMALQKDGKIVLAGSSTDSGTNDFALARYNSDGTQDLSFSADGELTTDIGAATTDQANAVALQADGRIVVVGSTGTDFAAVRYNLATRTDARIGAKNTANSGNNIYNTTGSGQTLNATVKKSGGKKSAFVRIQNDGHDNESFNVTGSGNTSTFNVRYFNGNVDITPNVVGSGFNTSALAPGSSFLMKVVVTAKTKKPNKNATFTITGKCVSDTTNTDVVLIKAKSK